MTPKEAGSQAQLGLITVTIASALLPHPCTPFLFLRRQHHQHQSRQASNLQSRQASPPGSSSACDILLFTIKVIYTGFIFTLHVIILDHVTSQDSFHSRQHQFQSPRQIFHTVPAKGTLTLLSHSSTPQQAFVPSAIFPAVTHQVPSLPREAVLQRSQSRLFSVSVHLDALLVAQKLTSTSSSNKTSKQPSRCALLRSSPSPSPWLAFLSPPSGVWSAAASQVALVLTLWSTTTRSPVPTPTRSSVAVVSHGPEQTLATQETDG